MSDGSFALRKSAALFNTITSNITSGSKTIPGAKQDHSSYRGELGGVLPAVVVTNELCGKYNLTTGKCTLGCDNKGALASSFG